MEKQNFLVNKTYKDRTLERLERLAEIDSLQREIGNLDSRYIAKRRVFCGSRLAGGKYAEKFERGLLINLRRKKFISQFQNQLEWPEIDPEKSYQYGHDTEKSRPIRLLLKDDPRHTVILAPTGGGKTSLANSKIDQLRSKGVKVIFQDNKVQKKEGRRLTNLYDDVLVVNPSQEPRQIFDPQDKDYKTHNSGVVSEIAKFNGIRINVAHKVSNLLYQIEKGRAEGENYISSKEFEHLLLRLAEKDKDKSLETAAAAFTSLNELLGESAYVSKAPSFDKWSIIVKERGGINLKDLQLLAGLDFLSFPVPNPEDQRDLFLEYVSDEGSIEFAPEASSRSGSGYITPQKKMVTQIRNNKTGITACIQSLRSVDKVLVANAGTFICLGANERFEQLAAARLLGLDPDFAPELGKLRLGEGYIRSPIFTKPVRFYFEDFNAGPYIDDAELDRRMKPALEWLRKHTVYSNLADEPETPLFYKDIIRIDSDAVQNVRNNPLLNSAQDKENFTFLNEVEASPDESVTAHYRELPFSVGKCKKIQDRLISQEYVRKERLKILNGRPLEILVITDKGKGYLSEIQVDSKLIQD